MEGGGAPAPSGGPPPDNVQVTLHPGGLDGGVAPEDEDEEMIEDPEAREHGVVAEYLRAEREHKHEANMLSDTFPFSKNKRRTCNA